MPRTARLVVPGWPHHIVFRGNNRRRLCSYASDYRRLIDLIVEAAARSQCLLHVLDLMANHGHIIATPPTATALSVFVKRFAQPFAQWRNRRRDGSGKLFEQRFYSRVIRSDEQLAICTAYVELNPVRAQLVDDPADYQWSTYRLHSGDARPSAIPRTAITPSAWYMSLGGAPAERAKAYRDFVHLVRTENRRPDEAPREPAPSAKRLERPNRTRAA